MTLTEDGKVGVGTTNPQRTLHVHGYILISGHEGSIYFGNEDQEQYLDNGEWAIEFAPEYEGNQSGLNFWKPSGSHNLSSEDGYGNYYLFINDDGNVGIGTGNLDANYKLTVKGEILCTQVNITEINNIPDYVFDTNYKLKSLLNEVEPFIIKNKHLPDVPSAKDIKNNGMNIGDMNVILLKKVEELTLYTIEQQKTIEIFKEQIEKLNKQVNELNKN